MKINHLLIGKRVLTCVIASILLVSVFLTPLPAKAEQTWYPGEGVTKGLAVKYRISHVDLNNGDPFIATLWFKEQNDNGDWITDTVIEYRDRVLREEMLLSSLSLTPLMAKESDEFRPYRTIIKDTLSWLDGYTNKIEPEPLDTGDIWGVIGTIGGGGIIVRVFGEDKVQVPAGEYDAHIIGFHYAIDSKLWVVDEFPFPVKAHVYTIIGKHPIPVQFDFELLDSAVVSELPEIATGNGSITPPLIGSTINQLYEVQMSWEPVELRPNEPVRFDFLIKDISTGELAKEVWYDLIIVQRGEIVHKINEVFAPNGEGSHTLQFESTGPIRVTVNVLGTVQTFKATEIQFVEFYLTVIPEFTSGIVIAGVAFLMIMVIMTRFRKPLINLFS
ncbi:MAG: hypothetical protein ACE5KA_06445 [Nitrososphaerales archaeon]